MAKGIALPIRVNRRGGFQLSEGDEQADKIVRLALSSLDNDNAFQQDLGLGQAFIFAPRTPAFRSLVLARLDAIFAELEARKLYSLDRTSIRFSRGDVEGEEVLEMKYVNLNTDEELTFSRTFSNSGGT